MPSNPQTRNGKGFEYAVLLALYDHYENIQEVIIVDSDQLKTAKRYYDQFSLKETALDRYAAAAVIARLEGLEPRLRWRDQDGPLMLSINSDAAGVAGDVRDVICSRSSGWEIGISCKHNHSAVKHSRLSNTIDFGEKWFGHPCSAKYFEEIEPIFLYLESLRTSSSGKARWSNIADKNDRIYVPLLKAFSEELTRLIEKYNDVPEKMIRYLIGNRDFYKVISDEKMHQTKLQVMKLTNGVLNLPSKLKRSDTTINPYKLPTSLVGPIGLAPASKNTIHIYFNNGWTIKMRIHSAKSLVEPSLKLDINFEGLPQRVFNESFTWANFI